MKLKHGFEITEIEIGYQVWLEKTINNKIETFRILWNDLNQNQQLQLVEFCKIANKQ